MTTSTTLRRTVEFQCDECGSCLDTEKFTFANGLEVAKAQGWRAIKAGPDWTHRCEDCA